MLIERQIMESRAMHERKVEEEMKRFSDEIFKNIHKIAGEVSQSVPSVGEAPLGAAAAQQHVIVTSSQEAPSRAVEVQHFLAEGGGRGYQTHGLTITTPRLTLPASSPHLVTSSGILITHPHSSPSYGELLIKLPPASVLTT